ncbi:MAG: glycosyltransferase [Candidatus Moraniibacteriota bacterium]
MKIAYIHQKSVEEIAKRLSKKGHRVFIHPSFWRVIFQDFEIIHFLPSFSKTIIFLISIFKRKTALIRTEIPKGVDVSGAENFEYLQKFNLQKGSYVLTVNQLNRKSNIKDVVEAFKSLEDQHLTREKKLVIVGSGSLGDEYFKEIKDSARGRESIIFIGDQNGEALNQLFSWAYCFVDPSAKNKMSQNVLEAMGYGKAVLVGNTKKNIETLDGEFGFIFQLRNIKDLEEKLVFMINNPALMKITGEKAMLKIQREFSWEKITNQIEINYEDALLQKGKALNKPYERNI